MSETDQFDLLIIGGGINGVGIARDAAGRGLRVLLAEQNDLASGTSSRSSKLVHGGLRYLETGQLRLVRESLQEREVLQRIARPIVTPLRFILPHMPQMRPSWLLKAGLWLYDRLGGPISLPHSGTLSLDGTPEGKPLNTAFTKGFFYSDCWVEDSRLVVLNAMDAAARGADILTYTRVNALYATAKGWRARLESRHGGLREVSAKIIVNAAGPWAADVLGLTHPGQKAPLRLIKGSHIVLPRLYDGPWAYLCQNTDGRVVFFLPYEQDFTLIGTTDIPFDGAPEGARCSEEEQAYLLAVAQRYFRQVPGASAIVHSFAGVRALHDNGAGQAKDISRDYKLDLSLTPAPVLSVYGGKITTYRRLAEQALALMTPHLGATIAQNWTATQPLPGADYSGSLDDLTLRLRADYPWLPLALVNRWSRLYGSRAAQIAAGASQLSDLGQEILPGLYEAELDYLVKNEFARTAQDILWRRTRLGLRLSDSQMQQLDTYLAKFA